MKEVSSLAEKLKAHLPSHQARADFIAQFVLSLIRTRSTNLYRVAEEFQQALPRTHAQSGRECHLACGATGTGVAGF